MHELGIAEAVLDAIRTEAAHYPDARLCKVGLRIGELAGLDAEAFRFCFEAMVRETDFETLQLEIEFCPRRQRCLRCGKEFVVREYNMQCPRCFDNRGECIGGDELELAFLEIEEHAAIGIGTESTQ